MAKYRVGRVRQEILREVNDILMKEVKDPRVDGVTITDVDLTGDLSQATIYYSTLSDLAGQRQKTEDGLQAATGIVRRELSKRLSLYKVPEIAFERDPSIDYGSRIDDLLKQIQEDDV
ncbi:ribosome-binding factor A [Suicoccus acidiformans]|uniref:Ribosome-binding factor A n=1 Tax=Suicoccus acidiformans TaxID=2036206 RepID=A0A347WK69_9LACT|nr:30S ribosome-binding factor RbfA [Suicoccus acidiformans]AXY25476.1 ribosome-binding factor A [Suicoccus acidiformans]